jgi:CHAT domain-containing protein
MVASMLDQRLGTAQNDGIQLAVAGKQTQIAHWERTNFETIADISRKLQRIDEKIMRQQSAELQWHAETSLTVESIQPLLDEQTLLIYYCVIQGELHVVTVTNSLDDIHIMPLFVTPQDVAIQWMQMQRLVLRYQTPNRRVEQRLMALYQILMLPIQERLNERSRLIIVPHRALAHIPYAALYQKNQQRFLCESHRIQIIPSATVLKLCQTQPVATNSPLLIGYPGQAAYPNYLLHVQDELAALVAVLPNQRTIFGERATVEQVNAMMPGSQLIHFAGHAFYAPESPLSSGIPLADGRWLRASDLYLQPGRLKGSLVVLSGCNTGKGIASGTDLLGFTSAFLYAGAVAVLTSLWRIDDQATSVFMRHFYEELTVSQCETAEALQLAQRTMLADDQYRAPYFWAPFVLTGASRSPFVCE